MARARASATSEPRVVDVDELATVDLLTRVVVPVRESFAVELLYYHVPVKGGCREAFEMMVAPP